MVLTPNRFGTLETPRRGCMMSRRMVQARRGKRYAWFQAASASASVPPGVNTGTGRPLSTLVPGWIWRTPPEPGTVTVVARATHRYLLFARRMDSKTTRRQPVT